MKMILIILFFSTFLSSTSLASSSAFSDFCVADLAQPNTPSGYPCKPPTNITVNDFVFSRFVPGIPISPYNVAVTSVFVTDFPSLNGLGISATRVDIGKNGVVPMHTHPAGTELLIMVEGELIAGFLTPNAAYVKTLKPGDIMVFPQGQLHFQINTCDKKAIAFAAYSSQNPGLQLLNVLLFGNNLPSSLVANTTFLDISQVNKLKALFGGSG